MRKSDLIGFHSWNNPDRFIVEIEILLEDIKALTERIEALQRENVALGNDMDKLMESRLRERGGL